jgi:YD repeat-containing protein
MLRQLSPKRAQAFSRCRPMTGRENANLGTGSLHVEIPLISLQQRGGHNLEFGIEYDSQVYNLINEPFQGQAILFWNAPAWTNPVASAYNWRMMLPYLSSTMVVGSEGGSQYSYQTNYVLTLSDGSVHSFSNEGGCQGNPHGCPATQWETGYSGDNQIIYLDTTSATTAVATTEDGTRHYFSIYGGLPSSIEDTNGNIITFSCYGGSCQPGYPPTLITDTLGRTITFNYSTVNNTETLSSVTYKNSNGQTSTFTFTAGSVLLNPTFVDPTSNCCGYNGSLVLHGASFPMLQSVTLPTGKSYSFQYDAFGEITNIAYPTGGYTAYKWARFEWNSASYGQIDARELVEKDVCRNANGTCSTLDTTTTRRHSCLAVGRTISALPLTAR